MDKLRKIGEFAWLFKERLVLVILIGVLGYQVYRIVFPTEINFPQSAMPRKPSMENLEVEVKPPTDFRTLPRPQLGNYALLHRRNPFWAHSGSGAAATTTTVTAESLGIYLLDIRETGGRIRARIRTTSTTKWYDQGEQFEQYQLETIDMENGEVTIFAEQYSQYLTVRKQ